MSLRRLTPPVLLLGLWACKPSVPYSPPPASIDYAVFDLTSSTPAIPQPNDLSLSFAGRVCGVPATCAQGELLQQFLANGGFPYDQEVPVTVDFTRVAVDAATGNTTASAPDLDVASLKVCTSPAAACNLLVMRIDTIAPGPAAIDAAATAYAKGSTKGTLTLRNPVGASGSRRWPAGARYLVAIRGGANGVHTVGGGPVSPEATFALLLQGKDLSNPENSSLLPPGLGGQLELLRQSFLPAFAAVSNFFPSTELAVLTTFQIAPATSWVLADAGAGQVPLPSDFLLDPATGLVRNVPAFGPLAPGLATLDGFSTTAMLLAPTSHPVLAASVAPANPANQSVFLYEYGPTGPVLVNDLFRALGTSGAPGYLAEPPPVTLDTATGQPCASPYPATCVSTVIGLQPAVAVPVPIPAGVVALPPLKEKTEYAVVVTKRVQAAASTPVPISPTTLGQILLLSNSVFAGGHSQIAGVSDADAAGLEAMRLALQPVTAKLQTDSGLTKADIAFAYTFRTQTITQPALLLGATPYEKNGTVDAFPRAPVTATSLTPTAAGQKYGVPPALLAASIGQFIDANVITFDLLDPQTGAFLANPALGVAGPIPALIALPAGAPPATGWPLVVFHHGLGRGRADMMFIASALTQAGMAVAAVDSAKHGDRSWCTADAECATGSTCDHTVFGNQGDPVTALPGLCTLGRRVYAPAAGSAFPLCGSTGAPPPPNCWDGSGGIAVSSGSFFVSGNLFRWRDTARQDVLDQSMLARVLTTPEGEAVLAAAAGLAMGTVVVDPSKVFYVGQSLGSVEGTVDLAANPRFSRAVLNVGGGTWVGIGTTSPAFAPLLNALLAGLGIAPGTPEFLQFIQVAKWVLDPADPLNFASHLVTDPLPNLLSPTPALQSPKAILGQAARCDSVIPNATGEELYGLVGLAPLDPLAASATPSLQWFMVDTTTACPADGSTGAGGATHGFLLDGANLSLTTKAQTNVAGFLLGAPVLATPVIP